LLFSEILRVGGDFARTVFLLPPHYRGHEEEISKIYNLAGTRDAGQYFFNSRRRALRE
jgi:hypothetical protein